MKFKKSGDIIALSLERGKNIMESLLEFCQKQKIGCGFFNAIGAVDKAEIAHYSVDTKKYSSKVLNEPLEIVSLSGNITMMNGKPYIHCHACLSDENMKAYAGHLKEATVSAACEIFIVKSGIKIRRKFNKKIGLNMLDF